MILGQSAATASCQAIDAGVDVQAVDYAALRERLLADKQVLDPRHAKPGDSGTFTGGAPTGRQLSADKLEGVVVDDSSATLTGGWVAGSHTFPRVGPTYHHDDNTAKSERSARYEAKLKPGRYEVRISYPPNANRATNVPVTITHKDGAKTVTINQKDVPKIEGAFDSLGVFDFDETGIVEVSNKDTDGYVIVDAVQFIPAE